MLNIILAQCNFTVGHLQANAEKILTAVRDAHQRNTDLIIFPELALSGYPPEDLLLRQDFLRANQQLLQWLIREIPENITVVIGYPEYEKENVYNSAAVIQRHTLVTTHRKQRLPNYGVFDEQRYFTVGEHATVFNIKNVCFGLTICEDLWHPAPAQQAKQAGAQVLIGINASPFHADKMEKRLRNFRQRANETALPLLYVNHCCGQDDLIFDGSSFALNAQGEIMGQAPFAQETLLLVQLHPTALTFSCPSHATVPTRDAQIYHALVLGVRDYVKKNNFTQVIVGFSGGIDSALTLAIAVDALGKENVLPVVLPSRYTSDLSMKAAREQLMHLQMTSQEISIEPSFTALLSSLGYDTENPPAGLTTQNLQARCRGVILMALANQLNALLLNTSNKSELAVGYGTLYGDMCGAYAVLKDVWKMQVYRLANYRNQQKKIIPQMIIDRPPSAELALEQLDTDSLPPYDILDVMLEKIIEQDESADNLIGAGFDATMVHHIMKLVKYNEYKRKQSPPGPRVTRKAFTRERRYPITTGFP